ncbi:MAG: polysaccharide deacetylase family protein [Planctomycetota bacterium]|jgi:peptidoglycan/xylan/chitin deacetylase (PgdA/CDA1 family)
MLDILGIIVFLILPAIIVLWILYSVYLEYRRDRIPILLYHRLLSKSAAEQGLVPDNEIIYVTYDTVFEQQMAHLHQSGYIALDFDDYLNIRAGKMQQPEKAVIITIDDGYLSSYTMAYPALKKYGLKATVFVAPEPDEHTRQLVEGVDDFLTDEQMREMADNNIAIQSHTLTHCILTDMDDRAAEHELNESRQRISKITHRPVDHIAIPRAGYSRRIKRLVKLAGYKTACCNNKGSANGRSDPFALPRIVMERDMTMQDFANSMTPKSSVMLRIVGNIKRIPERIGGPTMAIRIRNILYAGYLRPIFETRNLKKVIALCALAYLVSGIIFTWHLITR